MINRDIIAKLFEHFTDCYAQWYADGLVAYINQDPRDRLNAGDCGTAAIAVGWVLEQLYGYPVTYVDNQFHGYIKVDGVCYDTLNPHGQPDEDQMLGRYMNIAPKSSSDVRAMHFWFIQRDARSMSMICEFCGLYNVRPYRLEKLTGVDFAPEMSEEELTRVKVNIEKGSHWRIIINDDLSGLPKNEKFLLEWVEQHEPRLDRVVLAEMKEFEGNWYLYVNGHLCATPTGLLQYRRLNDVLMSHMLM